jgi:hypothetical protein
MPLLRMPHHATLCSSCLNCQSNFRLKSLSAFLDSNCSFLFRLFVLLLLRANILPDFLNWLFTLPPLRMPPHVTLCSSLCVPTSVVLQSCSSTRVPAVVFQHLRFSSRVPAVVFQHLRFISRVPAVVFQHLRLSSRVPAVVFQHLCFISRVPAVVFQHLRLSSRVPAVVFQHLRFISRVPAVVFQYLCFSSRVPFVLQFVFVLQHLFSLNNRLPSMTTLIICVILLLSPYLQQSPPLALMAICMSFLPL